VAWSNSARWRVEENTAREVGVTPLSEGRLLLEVSLDRGEVLSIELIMDALVGCEEMLVVDGIISLISAVHHALFESDRFSAAGGTDSGATIFKRGQGRVITASILRTLLLGHESGGLCAWLHHELILLVFVIIVVIDQDANLARVAPLVDVPAGLTLDNLINLNVGETLLAELDNPIG